MGIELLHRSAFERALDLPPDTLDKRTCHLLEKAQLRFETIDAAGQASLEAETAKRIENGFKAVGEERAPVWRDAWQRQLERLEKANYALEALNPDFVDGSGILRWQGGYIHGLTDQFELRFIEVLRDWLFHRFLGDVGHLYEFGSGSAFNVAAYARLFPSVPITALDWAPAAVRIADVLHERLGMNIKGRCFDFFAPDCSLKLPSDSGVLTMCALEQVGDRFQPLLDYFLGSRPKRVVHVEPILELYDPQSSHDRLAIKYHVQRNYLKGLLPALRQLEADGKIRMVFAKRLGFGSRF
ncbi:MAG TPA: class I SAM-dependent methyltransferase, partial [Reyranella sp.]|nr:class I SAM-dependent methyltransferase [Reyranella sp.]